MFPLYFSSQPQGRGNKGEGGRDNEKEKRCFALNLANFIN